MADKIAALQHRPGSSPQLRVALLVGLALLLFGVRGRRRAETAGAGRAEAKQAGPP